MICDPEFKEAAPRLARLISALSWFMETEMPGIYNQSQQLEYNQHEREERDDLCQKTQRSIGGLTMRTPYILFTEKFLPPKGHWGEKWFIYFPILLEITDRSRGRPPVCSGQRRHQGRWGPRYLGPDVTQGLTTDITSHDITGVGASEPGGSDGSKLAITFLSPCKLARTICQVLTLTNNILCGWSLPWSAHRPPPGVPR